MFQAVCENILKFFWGTMDTMMPNGARKHVPLVASLFLFILFANLMGQLPLRIIHLQSGELASPTNDINLTAALAIIVLVYYVGAGIKAKKGKFLLHEVSFVGIVMMLVELLENGYKTSKLGNPSFCKRICRRNSGNISTRCVCIPCAAAGYVL